MKYILSYTFCILFVTSLCRLLVLPPPHGGRPGWLFGLRFCLQKSCPQGAGRAWPCQTARFAVQNGTFRPPERHVLQRKTVCFASY